MIPITTQAVPAPQAKETFKPRVILLRIGGERGDIAALIHREDRNDTVDEAAWRHSYYRTKYKGQSIVIQDATEAEQEIIKTRYPEDDRPDSSSETIPQDSKSIEPPL